MSFRSMVIAAVLAAFALAPVSKADAFCGWRRRARAFCGYSTFYSTYSYGCAPFYRSYYYAAPTVWAPSVYYSRVITPTYYAPTYYYRAPVVVGLPLCSTTPSTTPTITPTAPTIETTPGVQTVQAPATNLVADAKQSDPTFRYSSFSAAPAIRPSNLTTLEKALEFVKNGDIHFKKHRFQAALQEYKAATRMAPDLAEGHFKQGFALVATNRYDLAADAMKRGMRTYPVTPSGPISLDVLYNGSALAQDAHRESLALAALDSMRDGDLFMLVGMYLKHEGQVERSVKFFRKAESLMNSEDAALLRTMLQDSNRVAALAGGRET